MAVVEVTDEALVDLYSVLWGPRGWCRSLLPRFFAALIYYLAWPLVLLRVNFDKNNNHV